MKTKYFVMLGIFVLLIGVVAYSILTHPYSIIIKELPPIYLP